MYSSYYGRGIDSTALTFAGVIGLASLVLMLAAQWKLLEKAGEKGWKCLIPVYGSYVWYKVTWSAGAWAAMIALSILSSLLARVQVLGLLISLAVLVMYLVGCHMVSLSYGKGGGFTAGLIFLPVVFYPVLAFGRSEYVGPKGVPVYGANRTDSADRMEIAGKETGAAVSGKILPAVLLTVSALFFLYDVYVSMIEYRPFGRSSGSPFVGLRNYIYLLQDGRFLSSLGSSFLYGAVNIAAAAAAGFAGAAAARGGNAARKACVAAGFLLAAAPRMLWESFSIGAGTAVDMLCSALPWTGLSLAAGALLSGRSGPRAGFVVPAVILMSLYSGHDRVSSLLMNPLNSNMMRADSYMNRIGLMMGQFSPAAAGYTVLALLTLLCGACGAVLTVSAIRGTPGSGRKAGSVSGGIVPGLIAAGLPAACGIFLISGSAAGNGAGLTRYLPLTAAEGVVAAAAGFGLFLFIQTCLGKPGNRSAFSEALSVFAVLFLGQAFLSKYLLVSRAGLLNTAFSVGLSWVLSPRALALAAVLALTQPETAAERVRNAAAAALLAVVFGIGETCGSYMYMSRTGDLSNLLYRIYNNSPEAAGLRPAVWGLTALVFALPVGAGTALVSVPAVKE